MDVIRVRKTKLNKYADLIVEEDYLPVHIVTYLLVIIAVLAVEKVIGFVLTSIFVIPGILIGFYISWKTKEKKLKYFNLLIDIFSLSVVIAAFRSLFIYEFNFENTLSVIVRALAGLQLFYSFLLRSKKDYILSQIIATFLMIASAVLRPEKNSVYISYLMTFLLLWLFTLRFTSLYEKKKNSIVIVDRPDENYNITKQMAESAVFFIGLIFISYMLFPLLPRLTPPSLGIIPSEILGMPRDDSFSDREFLPGMGREKVKLIDKKKRSEKQLDAGIVKSREKVPQPLIGNTPGPGDMKLNRKEQINEAIEQKLELERKHFAQKQAAKKDLLQKKIAERLNLRREFTDKQLTKQLSSKELDEAENSGRELMKKQLKESHSSEIELFQQQRAEKELFEKELFEKKNVKFTRQDIIQIQKAEKQMAEEDFLQQSQFKMELMEKELSENQSIRKEIIGNKFAEKDTVDKQIAEIYYAKMQELQRDLAYKQYAEENRLQKELMEEQIAQLRSAEKEFLEQRMPLSKQQQLERNLTQNQLMEKHQLERQLAQKFLSQEQKMERKFSEKQLAEIQSFNRRQFSESESAKKEFIKKELTREKQKKESPQKIFLKYLICLFAFIFLIILLFLIFIYIRCRREQRRLETLAVENPRLFIIKIYNLMSKLLAIHGNKRLVWMTPEEYLLTIEIKLNKLLDNFRGITDEFLEAKYSVHKLGTDTSLVIIEKYNNFLEQVKKYGKIWQNCKTWLKFKKLTIRISG